VVALNLAPATPGWLRPLRAEPMVLGLDLQGGVHFLMQVDMDTARTQQLERFVTSIRNVLRDETIRYRSVRIDRNAIVAELRTPEDREQALRLIGRELDELVLESRDGSETFNVRATIDESILQELQQTALRQNITTLRNRVNELGVSEPIIQQQGLTASWCSCRACRTPPRPSACWVRPPPWNIVVSTSRTIPSRPTGPDAFRPVAAVFHA
jgi:preprotein translocase subunit SecD